MSNIGDRIERAIEELAGNEALLEMLETDAAVEMLEWGKDMVTSVVKRTEEHDDLVADLALLPRLKAVRQSLRSVGNWAAGKYSDPADRQQLRDKLLQNFQTIFGDNARLPSPEKMDDVLNEVDDKTKTPLELVLKLKTLLQESL